MVRVYANLIIKGLKTIDDVPNKYKDAVLELLRKDGFDGYGEPLV